MVTRGKRYLGHLAAPDEASEERYGVMVQPQPAIEGSLVYMKPDPRELKELQASMLRHDVDRSLRGWENTVAFDSHDASLVGTCVNEGGSKPRAKTTRPERAPLSFDSGFESGNLRRAVRVDENEYDLVMEVDSNTKGHTQWFYYKVLGMQSGCTYKFNLVNFSKTGSLYNDGMKLLMFCSATRAWRRVGQNVCYYRNLLERSDKQQLYTLTFSVTCDWAGDEVYFAHCFPLTYTSLKLTMKSILAQDPSGSYVRSSTVCKTNGGLMLDCLTVTNFNSSAEELRSRLGVVITARVHPGETNGSWVMDGILKQLTSATAEAEELRNRLVFKLVPMVNPDGVTEGNYRSSLCGFDLNRRFNLKDDNSQRSRDAIEVIGLKNLIDSFRKEREVYLFCDFHGHSRKMDVFSYGCTHNEPARPVSQMAMDDRWKQEARLLPIFLDFLCPHFSYRSSSFNVSKSKANTGRVVAWKELKIPLSYTIEASFCGGTASAEHFTPLALQAVGRAFCESLRRMTDPFLRKETAKAAEMGLSLDEINFDAHSSEGSDANPSDDNFSVEELESQRRSRERKATLMKRKEKKEKEKALREKKKRDKEKGNLVMFGALRSMRSTKKSRRETRKHREGDDGPGHSGEKESRNPHEVFSSSLRGGEELISPKKPSTRRRESSDSDSGASSTLAARATGGRPPTQITICGERRSRDAGHLETTNMRVTAAGRRLSGTEPLGKIPAYRSATANGRSMSEEWDEDKYSMDGEPVMVPLASPPPGRTSVHKTTVGATSPFLQTATPFKMAFPTRKMIRPGTSASPRPGTIQTSRSKPETPRLGRKHSLGSRVTDSVRDQRLQMANSLPLSSLLGLHGSERPKAKTTRSARPGGRAGRPASASFGGKVQGGFEFPPARYPGA